MTSVKALVIQENVLQHLACIGCRFRLQATFLRKAGGMCVAQGIKNELPGSFNESFMADLGIALEESRAGIHLILLHSRAKLK